MPERQRLLDGFKKFRKKYYEDSNLMEELVKNGANPDFFIVHCIDPRSGANKLFHASPGVLFGDRVMAALVPPYEEGSDFAASLSYAVEHKKVKHIIILGHTHCGGIEALVKGVQDKEIKGWMGKAQHAFDRAKAKVKGGDTHALCAETERQAVILGLKNLMSYPAVKKAFIKGDITLNGWLFDMEHGDILSYDAGKDTFESLINLPPGTQQKKFGKGI